MNEQIKKLWEDATGNSWPRPGKFSAGETEDGLARFVAALTREHIAALAGIERAEQVLKDKFLVDNP